MKAATGRPHERHHGDGRAPRAIDPDRHGLAKKIGAQVPSLALIITSLLVLDGCEVIKGIFKAGVGVGVISVVVVLVLIGGIVAMVRK
jgi:hypothetical protein